mmetsp:Transcript_9264/g.17079  ORF Transcript_9264/g.17079 Transcript_9264/m.17079 type:complete len:254 (+) Transcript_9264:1035-1796(+)
MGSTLLIRCPCVLHILQQHGIQRVKNTGNPVDLSIKRDTTFRAALEYTFKGRPFKSNRCPQPSFSFLFSVAVHNWNYLGKRDILRKVACTIQAVNQESLLSNQLIYHCKCQYHRPISFAQDSKDPVVPERFDVCTDHCDHKCMLLVDHALRQCLGGLVYLFRVRNNTREVEKVDGRGRRGPDFHLDLMLGINVVTLVIGVLFLDESCDHRRNFPRVGLLIIFGVRLYFLNNLVGPDVLEANDDHILVPAVAEH